MRRIKLSADSFAVFEDKFGIDTDCCFWELNKGHFNGKIQTVIDVECRIKNYKPDGSYSIRMDKADFVKTISLEDFISIASYLLKDQSSIYMVHRPERLVDILSLLRKYKLEPKELKLVQPSCDKAPNLVLIKATKNAKPFLKVDKPLYIYNSDGTYTEELLKIYNKI